jgi:hypothetical protein
MVGGDAPTETAQLRAVLEMLTGHTRTPDDCYFCLWDGRGDIEGGGGARILDSHRGVVRQGPQIAPAFPPSVLDVPNRAYLLFRGSVSDFGDWGQPRCGPGQPRLHMPDPAFIWPADHAWCVANDVDPHWAGSELIAPPSTSFWLIAPRRRAG